MSDTDVHGSGPGLGDLAAPGAITVPEPNARSLPMPASVKEGHKVVDGVFNTYRSRVDAARKALGQAEKAYDSAIKHAQRDCEQAGHPAKIASIGIVRSVTLTETTIKTPNGEFRLTPDVEARAEQHGNKQVVQGWVFKSDNDRREIYLHLHGPDWADVVPFPMKYASMQPKDLHAFAAKVGVAARNSDRARAALAERVRSAETRLSAMTTDRGALETAAEEFVAAARDFRDLNSATNDLEHLLAEVDVGDRKVRKATEALADVHTKVREFLGEAEAAHGRIHQARAALPQPSTTRSADPAPAGHVNATLIATGSKKIQVIKVLREITGVGLADAKGFVDRAPTMILADADPATAMQLKSSLERAGASVLIEPVDVPEPIEAPTPPAGSAAPSAGAADAPNEPSVPAAPDVPASPDVFDQIRRLGELRDAGLITPDEFDTKKAELLTRL
jgi:large subunit ribosomal protein L7/L12